jgi:outer membrane protein OmpA-like peptidoglycan-associated protein/tetratricopeptide (TPR) repeat protein
MVDKMKLRLRFLCLAQICSLTFFGGGPTLGAGAGTDPCENVENEPAVIHESSVSINAGTPADLLAVPGVFAWESATIAVNGQVNINRSKYQDSVCFLFFCHDVTRIRDNFVSPQQFPPIISVSATADSGEVQTAFSSGSDSGVPGTPGLADAEGNSDPHQQAVLRGIIAPNNGGIVRQDCSADPQVCSSGSYSVRVKISSGARAKKLSKFLGEHRLTYSDILTQSILNENLRNSSDKVKGCVARGLLKQASAFHGPGTGESPAERQQILQEALSLAKDDDNVKAALASTYVETGQYGQARSTSESAITDIEKRISSGAATAGDYDTVSDSYANLAEVDWREIAGISTSGVANGIAHLQMAIDRTDKRLALYPFLDGADQMRQRRAGYAIRLAGMLARQGSFQSITEAAKPLETALQLLPDSSSGLPLSADVTKGDLISLLPVDRVLVNRSWSENKADAPLASSFILSRFEANQTASENAGIAWDRSTGQVVSIADLRKHPTSVTELFKIGTGCVVEVVGVGKEDAIALVADGSCDGASQWYIYKQSEQWGGPFTGKPESLAVSAIKDNKKRIAVVADGRVQTWLIAKDDKPGSADSGLADYETIRLGPDPNILAARKSGQWSFLTFDGKDKWSAQSISCSGGRVDDVALPKSGGMLIISSACGLAYLAPGAVSASTKQYSRIESGSSWETFGGFRFMWVGDPQDPVVVSSETKSGRQLLVFPSVQQPANQGNVDSYDVYVSDINAALGPARLHQSQYNPSTEIRGFWNLRVESAKFEARAIEADKTGRRMNWPQIQLSVRGVIGQLVGADPQLATPLQKSPNVNISDYKEFRRGKAYIWGMDRSQSAIVRLSDPVLSLAVPKEAQNRSLVFMPIEGPRDNAGAQLALYTNSALDQLIMLPADAASLTCQISATGFSGGVCSAEDILKALGNATANLFLVTEQSDVLSNQRKAVGVAVQSDVKTMVFPPALQSAAGISFPFGTDVTPIGLSNGPDPTAVTLFGLRKGNLVAARNGNEIPAPDGPYKIELAGSRLLASGTRLLVISADWNAFTLFEAADDRIVRLSCSDAGRHCPMSSGDFQSKLQSLGSDLGSLYGGITPTLTASRDLSAVGFVWSNGKTPIQWARVIPKSAKTGVAPEVVEETVEIRPGVPLLYAASPEEDVLSIQPARALAEQWSLPGSAIRISATPPAPSTPAAPSETETEAQTAFFVFFSEGSDEPLPSSNSDLEDAAACLQNWKVANITLTGFASMLGTREDNLALSRKRAEYVSSWLEHRGVDKTRLEGHTKGEGARGATSNNDSFSRRVEVWARGKMDKGARGKCEAGLASAVSAR